ncbi:MAG TPA: AprI/Inh family metalloprotease inhibitor [Methylocella sp.]|nr:AprI/Inh family metalloprotease inhibitor [Methylocella sp.]
MRWLQQAGLAASLTFSGLQPAAQSMAEIKSAAGVWELSADGQVTKCRIMLRPEAALSEGQHALTIPLACLRAFPVLGNVETWAEQANGEVDLAGRSGQTILAFTKGSGTYVAAGPRGETYRLAAMAFPSQESPPPAAAPQGARPAILTEGPKTPAAADSLAGRYSVLREDGKDTGCMLTLAGQGKAPSGGKASLAPGCRDQGIVIFDPASWQLAGGRLVLTARKGHKTHLDAQPDGTWTKDPKEGKTLSLKKL